jgi:hypothetical protein
VSHSPADVIRWLLVALAQGTDPTMTTLAAWPVYASDEPDTPDSVITTYDTTAQMDGRTLFNGNWAQHYGVQIRVRAANHGDGYVKAKEICDAIDAVSYQQVSVIGARSHVNQYRVITLCRNGEPMAIGKETPKTMRKLFTINLVTPILQEA